MARKSGKEQLRAYRRKINEVNRKYNLHQRLMWFFNLFRAAPEEKSLRQLKQGMSNWQNAQWLKAIKKPSAFNDLQLAQHYATLERPSHG